MTPAVTDWIPGDQKPTVVGVYERDIFGILFFSKWTGKKWMAGEDTRGEAAAEATGSFYQTAPWRGLASDPKGTK